MPPTKATTHMAKKIEGFVIALKSNIKYEDIRKLS
jgi:hypothetical protein